MASLAEILAAKKQATPALTVAATEIAEKTKEVVQLVKVAESAQIEASKPAPEPKALGVTLSTTRIIPNADEIIPRIQALEALADESLEDEMRLLKEALLQNPDAVALMLPEDIGMLVTALRRIVGESIAAAETGKKSKKKAQLSAEEMSLAFDEL